jgi:hypothetical protein
MPQEKTAQEAKICPIWSLCFRAPKKNISFRSTPMENCDWIIKQIKKQILDFSLKEGLVTMGQVLGDHTRFFFGGGGRVSDPLVPLLLLGPPFFQLFFFGVLHPVTRDDRQLLAQAMASDFSVAWQDQMSLLKKCPKCSPTHFCKTSCRTFTVEKSGSKIWDASVIFQKSAQGKQSPSGRIFV